MSEYETGVEWASLALSLMASDNNMSRTSKRPDIDATLAKQACRIGDDMEDFIQGDCCTQTRLAVMRCAIDFHEWLERCFDGDLSREYFTS
jgi:hypothetical protein